MFPTCWRLKQAPPSTISEQDHLAVKTHAVSQYPYNLISVVELLSHKTKWQPPWYNGCPHIRKPKWLLSRAQMRCYLLGCQHANNTYTVSQAVPALNIVYSQGGGVLPLQLPAHKWYLYCFPDPKIARWLPSKPFSQSKCITHSSPEPGINAYGRGRGVPGGGGSDHATKPITIA